MRIDNEFTVSVPIEQAWKILTDLAGIAPCLPGAKLTSVENDVYTGQVKIKVGPVTSQYVGTARFAEKDDAAYQAVIDARGKDSRGAGNASARISAGLRAHGESTIVTVGTDLDITGKIAQFGSGMMKEVSAKLLGQFAANLETKLATVDEPAATEPAAEPAAEPATGSSGAAGTATPGEVEPLDLLALAGSSVTKRLLPLAAAALVVALLTLWRRRR